MIEKLSQISVLERAVQHLRDQLAWRGIQDSERKMNSVILLRDEAEAVLEVIGFQFRIQEDTMKK